MTSELMNGALQTGKSIKILQFQDSFCRNVLQRSKGVLNGSVVNYRTCNLEVPVFILQSPSAEPHNSVGSVANLKTGGRRFDSWLGQYYLRGLMIVIATGFIPLAAVHCIDNGYLGKQPVAWK